MVLQNQGQIVPELLEYEQLDIPLELLGVWQDFLDLSNRRQYSESGPCSLTHQEVVAWAILYSITVTPLQAAIIFMLDDVWLEEYSKRK